MTVGISSANLATGWLNVLRNTTFTAIATVYVQLHTGDPGASGTANVSVGSTSRNTITWNAPSSGSMTLSAMGGTWTNGGTSETISHISFWSASSAGTFYASAALTASQAWVSTNTFTLNSCTWSLTPIAA
jgi:hypothetical protein